MAPGVHLGREGEKEGGREGGRETGLAVLCLTRLWSWRREGGREGGREEGPYLAVGTEGDRVVAAGTDGDSSDGLAVESVEMEGEPDILRKGGREGGRERGKEGRREA